MDDKQNTIGLSDLLDEVNRDLDEFRKKHPNDYSVKNVTLWWDMEKERLLTRHSPATLVRRLLRAQGFKRLMIVFFAGWATMLAMNAIVRLVLP